MKWVFQITLATVSIACTNQPVEADLRITEIMSSNTRTLQDDFGEYSDWIEITNVGQESTSLEGYHLSDDRDNPQKWKIPYVVLEPEQAILIYASKQNQRQPDKVLHTNFKLDDKGEPVLLSTRDGRIVHELEAVKHFPDVSWGLLRDSDKATYIMSPTPGSTNPSKAPPIAVQKIINPLKINEIQVNSSEKWIDYNGDPSDWIEIINTGAETISLLGYGLSDDSSKPAMWRFPDIEIEPQELKLIYASGKDLETPELHSNFKLHLGEPVVLSFPNGDVVDVVSTEYSTGEGSWGRKGESWTNFKQPTPGRGNNTISIESRIKSDDLVINEAMSEDNMKPIYSDWVEIYNPTNRLISLLDYTLTDDVDRPRRFVFPDCKIAPKSYFLLRLSKKIPKVQKCKTLRSGFSLSSGEVLFLKNPNDELVSELKTGHMESGVSTGRPRNDLLGRVYFRKPTPNAANHKRYYSGYASQPIILTPGGCLKGASSIEMASQSPDSKIHYTMDGSEPNHKSSRYQKPIMIEKNTTLRAIAIQKDMLRSKTSMATYLFDCAHTIPILSMAIDPDRMFDKKKGLHERGLDAKEEFPHYGANFWKTTELPVEFELINSQGQRLFHSMSGFRIFGGWSRGMAKKGFRLISRSRYQNGEFYYPFFKSRKAESYNGLVIRAGGQDSNAAQFRDIIAYELASNLNFEQLAHTPVAYYINGRYWGLYHLREKINEEYLANITTHEKEDIEIVEIGVYRNKDWSKILSYIKRNKATDPQAYQWVSSKIDIDNFRDWLLVQAFTSNADVGNVRIWRPTTENGKWRVILYDLDLTYLNVKYNTFRQFFEPPKDNFMVRMRLLYSWLFKSTTFKKSFLSRAKQFDNSHFTEAKLNVIIDGITSDLKHEITMDKLRWKGSYERWERNVDKLKQNFKDRRPHLRRHFKKYFKLTSDQLEKVMPKATE